MSKLSVLILLSVLVGCDEMNGVADTRRREAEKVATWNAPCADKSWLLATTSGSPSEATCPNKEHRMRVQVATTPSQEEIGALVFCECVRASEAADAAAEH